MKHPFALNKAELESAKDSVKELSVEEINAVSGACGDYTTMALGEEGGDYTTLAIGEEGGEGPQPTTMAIGEEGGDYTTLALGEEGGDWGF
ncbi:hypothetical protein [Pleionea sediminis]|uniref:hypothetical protein n=1 Tax=Pleionea sediminis TaxID=2569479 RepID=UPI001186210E|nr:hypothetical protein [Pleionea sediminis]